MKKLLLASTIAALSVSAAHAAPTVYGKAFVTMDYVDAENNADQDSDSVQINSNYSRLGFKGSEAMTENTDVIYQLEYQVDIDNDDGGSGVAFKNRDTYLGVKNDSFGQLRFGHQHSTLQHINNALIGKGYWDRGFTMMADSRRIRNSVLWLSPKYNNVPVQFFAMYGADESFVDDSGDRNNGYGLAAMYDHGTGFTAGLAYDKDLNINTEVATGVDPLTNEPLTEFSGAEIIRGTATYDMSQMAGMPLKLGGLYQVADYDHTDEDEKAFAVSATMGLSNFAKPATVYAQYIGTTDFKGQKGIDGNQIIVGGTYKYQPNMIMHAYAGNEDIDGLNETTTIGGGLEYLF